MTPNTTTTSTPHSTVKLHIYDIQKSSPILDKLGMGQYHSSVYYRNSEWTYADEVGIVDVPPRQYPGGEFKQEVLIGECDLSYNQFRQKLRELEQGRFSSDAYDVVGNNCNHFSDALCKALVGKGIPSWVNRAAKVGGFMSKLFLSKDTNKKMSQARKEQQQQHELHQKTRGLTDVDTREQLVEFVSSGEVLMESVESLNHQKNHTLSHLLTGRSHFQSGVEADCVLYIPFRDAVRVTKLIIRCHELDSAPKTVRIFKNKSGRVDLDNAEDMKCEQMLVLSVPSEGGEDQQQQKKKKKKQMHEFSISLKAAKFKQVRDLTLGILDNQGDSDTTRIDAIEIYGRVERSMNLKNLASAAGGS